MIWDNLNLPRDTGASDFQDSSRAAGMCVLTGLHPNIPLSLYKLNGRYVRHPNEYKYTFSRDQASCLFAGYWAAGMHNYADPNYKTEGDLVSPAVRGHFRRCAGLTSTFFQDAWLVADIYVHAWINPLSEPNQLISMLMVTDVKYLKLWCKLNKQWRDSILNYWCLNDGAWRGERDLAEKMISVIEEKIK